jgi:sporulation protein YlmC with PRC-barrel domain
MLLSDLLNLPVVGMDGSRLGFIVDVRFRRSARHGGREGDLELIALLVSPHSRQSTYGYERGRVRGPGPIAAVIRWFHRGSRIIPWECVARIDRDAVVLGVQPPVIPLATRMPIPEDSAD